MVMEAIWLSIQVKNIVWICSQLDLKSFGDNNVLYSLLLASIVTQFWNCSASVYFAQVLYHDDEKRKQIVQLRFILKFVFVLLNLIIIIIIIICF
jgi:hypothetical protein